MNLSTSSTMAEVIDHFADCSMQYIQITLIFRQPTLCV